MDHNRVEIGATSRDRPNVPVIAGAQIARTGLRGPSGRPVELPDLGQARQGETARVPQKPDVLISFRAAALLSAVAPSPSRSISVGT
jgi:hypothetical protein